MKRILFFVLFALCAVLSAQNHQGILLIDSPVYEGIKRLYAECGLAYPSGAMPWSEGEALHMLRRIEPSRLSEVGFDIYKSILTDLGEPDRSMTGEDYSVQFQPAVNPEVYYHSNTAIEQSDDWGVSYEKRQPLLSLPVEAWLGDTVYGNLTFNYKMMKLSRDSNNHWTEAVNYAPNFAENIPAFDYSKTQNDSYYFFRAGGALGGDQWNLYIGRDDTCWGWGHSGNLLVSDHFDFSDIIRFATWSDGIKYSWYFETFDDLATGRSEAPNNLQAFIGHRFEYRFAPWLTLNITEGVKIKHDGKNFDARYLIPTMFLHNLYFFPEDNNNIMEFGMDLSLPWGINTTGTFLLDQIQALGEDHAWPPGAFGALLSAEKTYAVGDGWLTVNLESVYTSPYLYLREEEDTSDEQSPGLDWVVDRFRFYNGYDEKRFFGYQYGPDNFLIAVNLDYRQWNVLESGVTLSFRKKGEKGLGLGENITFLEDEAVSFTELSGTVDDIFNVGVYGRWTPCFWLELFGQVDFFYHSAYKHIEGNTQSDVQVSLGASMSGLR